MSDFGDGLDWAVKAMVFLGVCFGVIAGVAATLLVLWLT
jgi:hypothetical protein